MQGRMQSMKKASKTVKRAEIQEVPPFDEVWIATDNYNIVPIPLVLPPKIWSDPYIGRRILPEVYAEKYGVNGFYLETEDYWMRDINVNMKPIVDGDGYITEITTYKIRDLSGSSHGRPVSRDMRLTKKDIKVFIEYLEPTLVPLSEPDAVKKVPPPESVLPESWTVDSMKNGFLKLRKALVEGDRDAAVKFAEFSRIKLPNVLNLDCHPFLMAVENGDVGLAQFLYSAGAYLYDRCFHYGRCGVSALELALSQNNLDMVRFLVSHWQPGEYGGTRAFEFVNDWDVLELMWPHLIEEDGCFEPCEGMSLGFNEAKHLFELNPHARFKWTEDLYREFKVREPELLTRIEETGAVNLDSKFFVERNDFVGFVAYLREYKREWPDNRSDIPRKVWSMDDSWFNAARDYLLIPTTYGGNGFIYQVSSALGCLFDDGEYEKYIKVAERVEGCLDDSAFYGHGDFPKAGTDPELVKRILEYMYNRHAPDGYWSEEFVEHILEYGDADLALKAVEETPQMLAYGSNEGIRMAGVHASMMCEFIAEVRDDGVFEVAVKSFLDYYEQRHRESGELPDLMPRMKFKEWLENGLARRISEFKNDLSERPIYLEEVDFVREERGLPRLQKAQAFVKTLDA